jgi:hypothetical protein
MATARALAGGVREGLRCKPSTKQSIAPLLSAQVGMQRWAREHARRVNCQSLGAVCGRTPRPLRAVPDAHLCISHRTSLSPLATERDSHSSTHYGPCRYQGLNCIRSVSPKNSPCRWSSDSSNTSSWCSGLTESQLYIETPSYIAPGLSRATRRPSYPALTTTAPHLFAYYATPSATRRLMTSDHDTPGQDGRSQKIWVIDRATGIAHGPFEQLHR